VFKCDLTGGIEILVETVSKDSCPPTVFRASQERVSLSWEAKALNGLELPVVVL